MSLIEALAIRDFMATAGSGTPILCLTAARRRVAAIQQWKISSRFATALQTSQATQRAVHGTADHRKSRNGRGKYAFGFQEWMVNGTRCFGHGGGASGMNGMLQICPVRLCNRGWHGLLVGEVESQILSRIVCRQNGASPIGLLTLYNARFHGPWLKETQTFEPASLDGNSITVRSKSIIPRPLSGFFNGGKATRVFICTLPGFSGKCTIAVALYCASSRY